MNRYFTQHPTVARLLLTNTSNPHPVQKVCQLHSFFSDGSFILLFKIVLKIQNRATIKHQF